jgi:hypothetical protein
MLNCILDCFPPGFASAVELWLNFCCDIRAAKNGDSKLSGLLHSIADAAALLAKGGGGGAGVAGSGAAACKRGGCTFADGAGIIVTACRSSTRQTMGYSTPLSGKPLISCGVLPAT